MSECILSGLLQYFPKNRAIVQKLGAEKKLSKSVSGYFMTKKNPTAIKPEGGPAIKKIIFFAASLRNHPNFLSGKHHLGE